MAPEKKVILYGTPFCSYCVAARALLTRKGVNFEDVLVSNDDEMRRELVQRSGRHTVPQIFIDDAPIGGFDELCELDMDGKLDDLLGQT